MFKISTLVVLFTFSTGSMAKEDYSTMKDVSQQFYEAYATLDAEKMTSLMHDEAIFSDETYAAKGQAIVAKGKEQIKKLYQSFGALATSVDRIVDKEFYAGNQAVQTGIITVHYKGAAFGDPGKKYFWKSYYIHVLTFKDGKIIRQDDFVDYSNETSGPE